jgi:hypothetical protein
MKGGNAPTRGRTEKLVPARRAVNRKTFEKKKSSKWNEIPARADDDYE